MKRNGRGELRHKDMLHPSSQDDIALADAVEQRFLDVCGSWLRVKGVHLMPPQQLNSDMLLWRRMRVRHKHGDFRNSDSELKATQVVAQWTLDCQCELRNQPKQTIKWRD